MPAGATAGEAPDGFVLIFAAPAAAGDVFHKSMPILRLVAGIETTGFPGTDPGTASTVLFSVLAVEKLCD